VPAVKGKKGDVVGAASKWIWVENKIASTRGDLILNCLGAQLVSLVSLSIG
jgi:hypothetical protein